MNAHTVLTQTLALLQDPARWTRGTFARDPSDRPVQPLDPTAVCFCLGGALRKVAGYSGPWGTELAPAGLAAHEALSKIVGIIPAFNDTARHDEVLVALRQAIAATSSTI